MKNIAAVRRALDRTGLLYLATDTVTITGILRDDLLHSQWGCVALDGPRRQLPPATSHTLVEAEQLATCPDCAGRVWHNGNDAWHQLLRMLELGQAIASAHRYLFKAAADRGPAHPVLRRLDRARNHQTRLQHPAFADRGRTLLEEYAAVRDLLTAATLTDDARTRALATFRDQVIGAGRNARPHRTLDETPVALGVHGGSHLKRALRDPLTTLAVAQTPAGMVAVVPRWACDEIIAQLRVGGTAPHFEAVTVAETDACVLDAPARTWLAHVAQRDHPFSDLATCLAEHRVG